MVVDSMDIKTFFNLNKTYSGKIWIYLNDWEVLNLTGFKRLNNIAFICGGIEYRVINNLVLKV